MPKRKSAVDEKFSFNECLEILATEGIDSENVPAELKGWVLVTALKKSSQTVHDQIFNDLYNNVLNGESGVRVSAPVEYESENEEEDSDSEVEEKGKGWTPAKHYSNPSKTSSGKIENRGAHMKKGAKQSSGPKVYQKIPKSQQKQRGRPKKEGGSSVAKKSTSSGYQKIPAHLQKKRGRPSLKEASVEEKDENSSVEAETAEGDNAEIEEKAESVKDDEVSAETAVEM